MIVLKCVHCPCLALLIQISEHCVPEEKLCVLELFQFSMPSSFLWFVQQFLGLHTGYMISGDVLDQGKSCTSTARLAVQINRITLLNSTCKHRSLSLQCGNLAANCSSRHSGIPLAFESTEKGLTGSPNNNVQNGYQSSCITDQSPTLQVQDVSGTL